MLNRTIASAAIGTLLLSGVPARAQMAIARPPVIRVDFARAAQTEVGSTSRYYGPSKARRVDAAQRPTAFSRNAPHPTVRKIVWGILGGVGGAFAGASIGSSFTQNCRCDDPGLTGALIGLPIGAAAGAGFGVWLASR
jgi:hypothetical protein